MKTIIVGNKLYKLYKHLNIGKQIDLFDNIFRCNLGYPRGSNGTKPGKIGLCNHLFKNLIHLKADAEKLKKAYFYFKHDEIDNFFKSKNELKFDLFYAESVGKNTNFNTYLRSIGCPYYFKSIIRTGYAIIMKQLINRNKDIYVSHFSIFANEKRDSFSTLKDKGDSHLHNSENEMQILRWLHINKYIDASLCLLKDSKEISFVNDELEPSEFIKEIL